MPVVKARRDQPAFQRAKAEAHVGVDEHRMKRHEHEVRVHRPVSESQQRNRDERDTSREHNIDQVQAGSGQPVDGFT